LSYGAACADGIIPDAERLSITESTTAGRETDAQRS